MSIASRAKPSRDDIIEMVGRQMYSGRILNNSHRGHIAEIMVLAALGTKWKLVGLGWHPWDLQRGAGKSRVRIQVKQSAWLQLWTPKTHKKDLRLNFGWKESPPAYFRRDNKDEEIEKEGWFCDLFVFAVHGEKNRSRADQVDLDQWKFLVVPTCDLERRLNALNLAVAEKRWPPVPWSGLAESVDAAIKKWKKTSAVGR